MFKTNNKLLKTTDNMLLKYTIDLNYLCYLQTTAANQTVSFAITQTAIIANDKLCIKDTNTNTVYIINLIYTYANYSIVLPNTGIYKLYFDISNYDNITGVSIDFYYQTNKSLYGAVGNQWNLLTLSILSIKNPNFSMQGYGLIRLKSYSKLTTLALHATNIKLEIEKIAALHKINNLTLGDTSQIFNVMDIIDTTTFSYLRTENRVNTLAPLLSDTIFTIPTLTYIFVTFSPGTNKLNTISINHNCTYLSLYKVIGNIIFNNDAIPMNSMTISYLSGTTVNTAPYHLYKQVLLYAFVEKLTGNTPLDYKLNPDQPDYDIDIYEYSKNKTAADLYLDIHTSYVPTRVMQLTTLIRARDVKSFRINNNVVANKSYYVFDETKLTTVEINRLNALYYSDCLSVYRILIDLDCTIIQNSIMPVIEFVSCDPYINGIRNINMLLTRTSIPLVKITFNYTTMLNSQINSFIDLLFTNRNNFTTVAKTLSVVGLTTNGIYRSPNVGTYTGNINDLNETQLDNLYNGLDYTGSGSSIPWTTRQCIWILVNLKQSSAINVSRYRWTVSF